MINFYGGPNGKSFIISWIFSTRYGDGNSMQRDINMGWKSPIPVGSFVVISYGEPNSTDYDYYLNQDLDTDNKTYNSTLWEKIYDENKNNNNGITYRLIMSMAGYTPRIEFLRPIDILNADELPDIIFDNSNIDRPTIKLRLPQSQVLSMNSPIDILDADEMPEVIYDDGDSQDNTQPGEHGGTINRPILTFRLPQSQRIQLGTVTWIKANEDPRISLDLTDINKPTLNFWLPVAQEIQEGTTTILDANEMPRFEIDSTDPDNPIFNMWLPQSQVMQQPETTVVDPLVNPSVVLNDSDINKPKLEFELPRAIRFYYGSLLGERTDSPYTLTGDAFVDYGVGDYYINAATGFIYRVSSKPENNICVFDYVACIQSPLPEVEATEISPYTVSGLQNTPTIKRVFTNNQQTAWKLIFGLPKAPKPDVEANFIAPAEQGSASVSIVDPDTMKFSLNIPRGSRMFSDKMLTELNQLNYHVEGAEKGDLCINPESGKVFIQTATDVWTIQQGCLKGPKGDALHIVKSYELSSDETPDTLSSVSAIIQQKFLDDQSFWDDTDGNGIVDTPRMPKDDEIISVTWKQTGNDTNDISYWYYYNEIDGWQRVQLTAGFFSSIMNEYDEDNSVNKLYSTKYINSLIGGNIPIEDYDKKTFSVDQLLALFEWGDIQNAETDVFPPEPSFTHNTLSADEILELLSWGSMGKLQLEDKNNSLVWGELP